MRQGMAAQHGSNNVHANTETYVNTHNLHQAVRGKTVAYCEYPLKHMYAHPHAMASMHAWCARHAMTMARFVGNVGWRN